MRILYLKFVGILFILAFLFCGCKSTDSSIENIASNEQTISTTSIKSIPKSCSSNHQTTTTISPNEQTISTTSIKSTSKSSSSSHQSTTTASSTAFAPTTLQPQGDTMNASNIKIIVKDSNGHPVPNLQVKIKHLLGNGYYYSPELYFTDLNGCAYGNAIPMKYQVIIEDVGGDIVYNRFTADFEVMDGEHEYTFIWPFETPTERKKRLQNSIVFRLEADGKALKNAKIDLYVGHYETNERWTTSYPDVIQLGYSDANGYMVWDTPELGEYTIFTYIQKGEEEIKVSKQISVDSIPYKYSIDFET